MDLIFFLCALIIGLIPNLITSILAFVFFLIGVALSLFSMNLEFFGLIFMLVYVGAIAVLFIFVTMLIHFFENLKYTNSEATNYMYPGITPPKFDRLSYGYSALEFIYVVEEFEEDDFDIFAECVVDFESQRVFDLLYSTSEFFVGASLLFTLYFPALVICTLVLLLITIGIFFVIFVSK